MRHGGSLDLFGFRDALKRAGDVTGRQCDGAPTRSGRRCRGTSACHAAATVHAYREAVKLPCALARSRERQRLEVHLGQEADGALDRLAGIGWGTAFKDLGDVTFQDLARHAIHASASGQDLGHDLFAGLAVIEHADDAANLPLDAPKTHLDVRLSVLILHHRYHVPPLNSNAAQHIKRALPPVLATLPPRPRGALGDGEHTLNMAAQGIAALVADDAVDLAPVMKEDQRGDALNAQSPGDIDVLIGVELGEGHLVLELACDLLKDWRHHEAGSAPGGPKVHDNR